MVSLSGPVFADSWHMTAQPTTYLEHDRVREHTAPIVNQRIDRLSKASADAAIQAGHDAIQRRLAELDHEWDVDRALMVNFAGAGATTFGIGMARYANSSAFLPRRKGFLYFYGAQLGFLLLHGVVGWCPPASVFRRLGFRTAREIEAERALLRAALVSPTAAE